MTDAEREELARILAGRKAAGLPLPEQKTAKPQDAAVADAIVRLTGELHRTERRLDRLEVLMTRGRYQTGGGAVTHGRYARLCRRADRIERELRSLR